jgi:hypothetical protein
MLLLLLVVDINDFGELELYDYDDGGLNDILL